MSLDRTSPIIQYYYISDDLIVLSGDWKSLQQISPKDLVILLAWSFTTWLNCKVTIWWGFFRQTGPAAMPAHIGADSLKKPHHIITLQFSEVVKDRANCILLAWSFTTSLNRKVMIWWGFFRLSAPICTGTAAGAVCLKKPHHIIT